MFLVSQRFWHGEDSLRMGSLFPTGSITEHDPTSVQSPSHSAPPVPPQKDLISPLGTVKTPYTPFTGKKDLSAARKRLEGKITSVSDSSPPDLRDALHSRPRFPDPTVSWPVIVVEFSEKIGLEEWFPVRV